MAWRGRARGQESETARPRKTKPKLRGARLPQCGTLSRRVLHPRPQSVSSPQPHLQILSSGPSPRPSARWLSDPLHYPSRVAALYGGQGPGMGPSSPPARMGQDPIYLVPEPPGRGSFASQEAAGVFIVPGQGAGRVRRARVPLRRHVHRGRFLQALRCLGGEGWGVGGVPDGTWESRMGGGSAWRISTCRVPLLREARSLCTGSRRHGGKSRESPNVEAKSYPKQNHVFFFFSPP
jgi:hypothetical protein